MGKALINVANYGREEEWACGCIVYLHIREQCLPYSKLSYHLHQERGFQVFSVLSTD